MKVSATNLSFKGLNIRKLKSIHTVYIPELEKIEKMTDGVDIFLKSVRKSFPFRKSSLTCDAVEIWAQPKNINWFEKFFGLKKQRAFYPVGNLRPLVDDPKPPFEELLKDVIARVKS